MDSRSRLALFVLCFVLVAGFRSAHAEIVINEVLASNQLTNVDDDGDSSDWVELLNTGDTPVDLEGFALTDRATEPRRWAMPSVVVPPGGRLLVWCSGKDRTTSDPARIVERDSPLIFTPDFISLEDTWKFTSGTPIDEPPPADWFSESFDDSGWQSGLPRFGFARSGSFGTAIPAGHTGILMRREFTITGQPTNLILEVAYDDGFILFLNGERVLDGNVDAETPPDFTGLAARSHTASRTGRFDLTEHVDKLRDGTNVLAIIALNLRETSNDLIFSCELGSVPPAYHTDFEIASAGETIFLTSPEGEVVDEVTLPEQVADQSYARSPDGTGPFSYHLTPSPLAENTGSNGPVPLLVRDTTFSMDRGFYEEPFDVEITTLTKGAQIRYTLDGSEPSADAGLLYEGPIRIERTSTLRAIAVLEGFRPSNVDTQTYIFLDEIISQNARDVRGNGFPPTWGATPADYDMDRDVIGPNDRFGGIYAETIRDDLLSLPTMSIVMDVAHLLGPQGIYTHSGSRGAAWERSCSVEYFDPNGEEEFQATCGIRIQGGYFRSPGATPKHSLRLIFKRIYGPGKLESSIFGEDDVQRFDTITLRAGANDGYSWNAARLTEQYTRDQFGRDLLRAAGQHSSRGRFVHLYLNGLYWGLYNPSERPDHSFSAEHWGGDKDDWDSVHDLAPTNGTTVAWNLMVNKANAARSALAPFMELQGRNPDGSPNPDLPDFLDVENYIDYLIVNVWGGNWDWPWKNWWAARENTSDSTGFKFYCWDYENTMGNNRNRSPLNKNALQNNFSSAGLAHTALRTNPEYRLVFGDRAQRLLFNSGPLTPEKLIPRYDELTERVAGAIVAESARWGDQHHHPPLTKREWSTERNWLLRSYLPQRTQIVIDQLRAAGLYPRLDAPEFAQHGGIVESGYRAFPRSSRGSVLYTTIGVDPRLPGGEISPLAIEADPGESLLLLAGDEQVRYHVPADDSLGLDWISPDFDDVGWMVGASPIGYETGSGYEEIIATDITAQMHEVNPSVYARYEFEVEDPNAVQFPLLRMRFDDGFIVYLNGERIAESRAPEDLAWNSTATGSHADSQARVFEEFPLPPLEEILRPGRNVLAIHALNRRVGDADFLMQPELSGVDPAGAGIEISSSTQIRCRTFEEGSWSALQEATFIVDTDIPLRITELHYHPPAPTKGSRFGRDEFEFVEFQNVGDTPIRLDEIRVRGGIEFEFVASEVRTLEPGERVVIVENEDAFAERYGSDGILVAGKYRGKLANDGEQIIVEGFLGEPILDFAYGDWYEEADGAGRALVFIDPTLPRDAWKDPANWTYGEVDGGSPGTDDASVIGSGGLQLVGDSTQDGRINISDASNLLRLLFFAEGAQAPCAGALDQGGNVTLHDTDGNGRVELTDAVVMLNYLFLRGAPGTIGTECVRIEGCDEACDR